MSGRLLLVHSPLVGRATWDLVAAGLAGRGYPVRNRVIGSRLCGGNQASPYPLLVGDGVLRGDVRRVR